MSAEMYSIDRVVLQFVVCLQHFKGYSSKSEVIGRCGGDEKNEWPRHAEPTQSRSLKKKREKKGMNLKYLKSPFYSKAVKTFLRSSLNIHLIKGVNVMLFYLLLYYIVLTTLLLSPPRITLQRIIIQTQGVWPRFFISRFNEVHGRKSWTNCLNTGEIFFLQNFLTGCSINGGVKAKVF